ncbi:MAG: ATP-grasp domain-containing protein [Bacteroidales bacterium]|nr:ATP-grasp domain-containing protein [Bacteroidales bacterium]
MKKAWILHQKLPENAPPDELDVLVQAQAIENSLKEMGFSRVKKVPVSLNLEKLYHSLLKGKPDVVVNLVETLGGQGRLIHLVTAMLDFAGLPYTGTGQYGLNITTDKVKAKELLVSHALPTPLFFRQGDAGVLPDDKRFILKPVWEDASVGIRDENVVYSSGAPETLGKLLRSGIREWFFEEYIDGREFNVTLLETASGWKAFTPAEIRYQNYPEGKPRILGYESKWHEDSFEYLNTVRTFDHKASDAKLVETLMELALKSASVFRLGGYARVDMRLDENNRPYILEVNANPCLSPDAGFFAACSREGMSYTRMTSHIIDAAFKNKL